MSKPAKTPPQTNIKVICRFRPPNKREIKEGGGEFVTFPTTDTVDLSQDATGGDPSFTFDRVFPPGSSQKDVFDYSIKSTVDDLLEGYNGTVLAYGQTGAGKSYTMMGMIDDQTNAGIIPRIAFQIFQGIREASQDLEFTIKVSYLEIYNENIHDLLPCPPHDEPTIKNVVKYLETRGPPTGTRASLPLHVGKDNRVFAKGLAEHCILNTGELYQLISAGNSSRSVTATKMNEESSRSHAILLILLEQKHKVKGTKKLSQLYLVDLAGSEKINKTGVVGGALKEAQAINKSLSALGIVMNALAERKSEKDHIPYRDSKMTFLLRESLGGNSRTTLIVNCSPNTFNQEETISTLRFGMRAKKIKNKATVNIELNPAELKAALIREREKNACFKEYLKTLENETTQWRQGKSVPEDQWAECPPNISLAAGAAPASSKPTATSTSLRSAVTTAAAIATEDPNAPPTRPESSLTESDFSSRPPSGQDFLRPDTPSLPFDKDEREEARDREKELINELADKDKAYQDLKADLAQLHEDLAVLKEANSTLFTENEKISKDTIEIRRHNEQLQLDVKDNQINLDSVKEENTELTEELKILKRNLLESHASRARADAAAAGGDNANGLASDAVANTAELASADATAAAHSDPQSEEKRAQLKEELMRGMMTSFSMSSAATTAAVNAATEKAKSEYSARLSEQDARIRLLQEETARLLEAKLEDAAPEHVAQIKEQLSGTYDAIIADRDAQLEQQTTECHGLRQSLQNLQQERDALAAMSGGQDDDAQSLASTVGRQITEFDFMKKNLMMDLQNRCEKVVELEISLGELRERYNDAIKSSNTRAQRQKMIMLEHNLVKLVEVQSQLVDQNALLKSEVKLSTRRLEARNERVKALERLLDDTRDKLSQANSRFEAQVSQVKRQLEAARASQQARAVGDVSGSYNGTAGGSASNRIIKQLRGGGGEWAGPQKQTSSPWSFY